jgi:hypothetical protein
MTRRMSDVAVCLGGGYLLLSGLGQLGDERCLTSTDSGQCSVELRDPRVAIVRHHRHPGRSAPLRDGARIARGPDVGL